MKRALRWSWLPLLLPSTASAHAEDGVWTFDPWVVTPLLLTAALYSLWRNCLVAARRHWSWDQALAGWLLHRRLVAARCDVGVTAALAGRAPVHRAHGRA